MSPLELTLITGLAVGLLLFGSALRPRSRTARTNAADLAEADPVPVRRRRDLAPRPRRRAATRPRRRRHARPGVPRPRADAHAARLAASAPVHRGHAAPGDDRAACVRRSACPWTRAIERGRTVRHAMREAIAHERYDRLVVAAASGAVEGFHGDDIAWLLDHAPGEVVVDPPGRRRPGVATPSREPPPPARAADVRQRVGSRLNAAWPADPAT